MKHWFTKVPPHAVRQALLIAMAVALPSTASLAQGTRAQRIACTPDVWRLCSSEIPSVQRIIACLKRERAQLSPGCQAVFSDQPVQTAVAKPPAPAPAREPAANIVTHAAAASSTTTTRSLSPTPTVEAVSRATPAPSAVAPATATPPVEAASQAPEPSAFPPPTATPSVVAASQAPPPSAVAPPTATPSVETALQAPAPRTAAPPTATPPLRVASRDTDRVVRVVSRHGRRQYAAAYQSNQSNRRVSAGYGHGGMMARMAPYIAMAMSVAQSSGVDVGSMMGGGQGGVDVGQMMGMARSMGFDPSALMGGYGR
jgi:hypothetical protein